MKKAENYYDFSRDEIHIAGGHPVEFNFRILKGDIC